MGDPGYVLGMDFINLYKDEVGAFKPKEDFFDRHDMYTMYVPTYGEMSSLNAKAAQSN